MQYERNGKIGQCRESESVGRARLCLVRRHGICAELFVGVEPNLEDTKEQVVGAEEGARCWSGCAAIEYRLQIT